MTDNRITSVGSYIEITYESDIHVTSVGAYVEVTGTLSTDDIRVSTEFAYVELKYASPDRVRVSSEFAYAELRYVSLDRVRVSSEFAYAELKYLILKDIRVSTEFAYAELKYTPPADIRVSTEFAYAELLVDSEVAVSKVLAYLGTVGQGITVSQFGAYAEILGKGISVAQVVALIELEYVEVEEEVATYQQKTAGRRAIHSMLPDEKTGWALDPAYSFWSIVIPEEGKNYWPNPGFHDPSNAGITYNGWASQGIEQGYPYGIRGPNFYKMVPNPGSTQGFVLSTSGIDLTAGYWTWSVWVWGWIDQQINLRIYEDVMTTLIKSESIRLKHNGWQRISTTWIETGSVERYFYLGMTTLGVTADKYICTDGWQIENKPYATTLIDGDMLAPNDSARKRSFYWEGHPMSSASIRKESADGHGRIISFSEDFDFYTTGIIGLGMNEIELILKKVGNTGIELYQGAYDLPRDFTITGRIYAENFRILLEKRERIIELLRSNRGNRRHQITLRYQPADSEGNLYGVPLDITCAYKDGMKGNITNDYTEQLPLSFHASHPFLQEEIENTVELTMPELIDTSAVVYRDENGTWQKLGNANSVAPSLPYDKCFATYIDAESGRVYAGGKFAKIGDTAVNNAAYWSGTAWVQLGSGVGFDGTVKRIKRHNHYVDGIIFCGEFIKFDGSFCGNAVRYNPDTDSVFTIAGVVSHATLTPSVNDVVSTSFEAFYIGGAFDNPYNYLYQILPSGATADLITGGLNGPVNKLILKNGWLYVCGDFSHNSALTVTLDKLIRIKVSGDDIGDVEEIGFWEPDVPGSTEFYIHDMEFDRLGNLYIAWIYLEGGAADIGISMWDGTSWSDIVEKSYASAPTITKSAQFSFDTNGDLILAGFIPLIGYASEYNTGDPVRIVNGRFFPFDIKNKRNPLPGLLPSEFDWQLAGGHAVEDFRCSFVIHSMDRQEQLLGAAGTLINYSGNANVVPYIGISGPVSVYGIRFIDTGGEIWFKTSVDLADLDEYDSGFIVDTNERAYIYLDNGKVVMWSTIYGDITNKLAPEFCDFTNVYLHPGENRVTLLAATESSNSQVWIGWHNKYVSFDSSVAI